MSTTTLTNNNGIDMDISRILDQIRQYDGSVQRQPYDSLNIAELVDAFGEIGKVLCPGYVIDNANRACIGSLVKWLFADTTMQCVDPSTRKGTAGDIHKGVYLYGPTGAGKSLCIAILWKMAYYFGVKVKASGELMPITWTGVRCDDAVSAYVRGNSLEDYKKARTIFFDDLGTEPTDAIYMGQRLNVMRSIIEYRGDQRTTVLTIITSNIPLDSPDLASLYGDRAVSRLKQMCNFLVLGGKDRRK